MRVTVLRETISAVINPTPANDARPPRHAQAAPPSGIPNPFKAWFGKDKKKA